LIKLSSPRWSSADCLIEKTDYLNIFKSFLPTIRNTLADVYKPGILWALPALREHSRN
jgi:hypothetical protein